MIAGRRLFRPAALGLMALALCFLGGAARAQIGSARYSSIVIEAQSGNIISAVNQDEPRYPASLTKLMTLYMAFEALRDRRITLDQLVPISPHAASMIPTKLGVRPGARLTVEEAILGMVTLSANDAAAALGELLGGDETRFGQMMTLRARALGMSRSVFHNASGLPDPDQVSTARDMATLARRLIYDFPQQYQYFSVPNFRFRNRTIFSHDHMLERYPGADGLKTGYTVASGFNLVTSAVRGHVRLVGVVMGAARAGERDLHMVALLDQGFERMDVPAARQATASLRIPAFIPAAQATPISAANPALPPRPRPQTLPRWSVQVGAFATENAARQAAAAARRVANDGDIRVESVTIKRKTTFRAQLTGMSQSDAVNACAALAKRKMACQPVRPDNGQVASR